MKIESTSGRREFARLTLRRSVADLDGWQRAAKIGFRGPGELGREAIATRADATLRARAP